jgi:DNA-binding ferritin-like protein (Dps family)
MLTIRQLIEHLDVIGDYRQFALEAEPFGDDLMQAWVGIENGAHLLWLAAAVGVEPKQIITVACDLLAEVFEQIETAGQETAQVLEVIHAW